MDCEVCTGHLGRAAEHFLCEVGDCRRGVCLLCHPAARGDWYCVEHAPRAARPRAMVREGVRDVVAAFTGRLRALSEAEALAAVRAACEADSRPARRWLPASQSLHDGVVPACLSVVLALALAADGSPAAEVVALFFPRLFLRVGSNPLALVRAFAGLPVTVVGPVSSPSPALSPGDGWVRRVGSLAAAGARWDLERALDAGPGSLERPSDAVLDGLFPPPGPFPHVGPAWANLADAAEEPSFSGCNVRQWAHSHRAKSGGRTGWSGELILRVDRATHPLASDLLAELWSRPRHRWRSGAAYGMAFRSADGWLLRKPGGGVRPISAPLLPRRLASAADARRVRARASQWASGMGQVGLAGDGVLLARSFAVSLLVSGGATLLAADRKDSYQSLRLPAVSAAVGEFIADACAQGSVPEANAMARLATQCALPGAGLGYTLVDFGQGSAPRPVCGLAQGCSSSATLQALVLATVLRGSPARGEIYRSMAHDDLVVVGDRLDAFSLPDCAVVGGVYNAAKSIAVGPLATGLVGAGIAASAARHVSVWGRPVGDVAAWVAEVLVPRVLGRMDAIRRVHVVDPEAAVAAFCCLAGPGCMVEHFLRGCTPVMAASPFVRGAMRSLDLGWLRLAVDLAGGGGVDAGVQAAVFGSGHAALGHRSAEVLCQTAPWAGLKVCWGELVGVAGGCGLPWVAWAAALGIPGDTPAAVARWIADREAGSGRSRALVLEAMAASAPLAAVGSRGNLWVGALSVVPSLDLLASANGPLMTAAARSFRGAGFRAVALSRVLGLPVWRHLWAGAPPTVCSRCNVPRVPATGGGSLGPVVLPTKTLDDALAHAGVCRRAPPWANATVRHDMLGRGLAAVSAACGSGARVHDRPLGAGFGLRPADLMEPPGPGCPLGRAIDVTVVTVGGPSDLVVRERGKAAGYAGVLAAHVGLVLDVFAVSEAGHVGPGADGVVRRWTRALQLLGSGVPDPVGAVRASVARAFVVAWMFQVAGWAVPPGARGVGPRARTGGFVRAAYGGPGGPPVGAGGRGGPRWGPAAWRGAVGGGPPVLSGGSAGPSRGGGGAVPSPAGLWPSGSVPAPAGGRLGAAGGSAPGCVLGLPVADGRPGVAVGFGLGVFGSRGFSGAVGSPLSLAVSAALRAGGASASPPAGSGIGGRT